MKLKHLFILTMFLFIGMLCISSINAINEDTGVTPDSTSSNLKNYAGTQILIGDDDLILNNVTRMSGSTFPFLKIGTTLNGDELGTFSYSGDTATVTGVQLSANTIYYIQNYNTVVTGWRYDSGSSLPITGTTLNWTHYITDELTGTNFPVEIQRMDVTIGTLDIPTLSFENITTNDITFTNNSYWDTSHLDWYVEVLNTSTNGNVDIYYSLWNSTDKITDNEQIADNSLNTDNFKYNFTTFNNPQVNIDGTDYYIYGGGGVSTNTLQYCKDNGFDFLSSYSTTPLLYFIFADWFAENDWYVLNTTPITRPRVSQIICYNERNFTLSSLTDNDYNIQFFAENNETNVTSTNYTFTVDTTPPTINNNIPTEINSYTLTLNSSCTDTNLDYCNITINNQTTALNSTNITLTENGNLTYTITAEDLAGNIATETGTLLVNPRIYFFINSSGLITDFTLGGRASVNDSVNYTIYNDGLVLGNNTLEFQKVGYQTSTFTFEITNTTNTNFTFNVSEAEINIVIYDKINGSIVIGETFTLQLVGSTGYNTTTITGTKTISGLLLGIGDYRLIVSSSNYESESEFFTFTNQEQLNLSIFVTETNNSNNGFVILEVLDDDGAPISNAIVQAKQWDGTTSSYISVSEDNTGSDGKGLVNIILNDKIYVFSATFGGFTSESNDYIITTANNGRTIILTLILEEAYLPNFDFEDVVTNVTEDFNSVTNVSTVTFKWENTGGDITGCVNAYRLVNYQKVLVGTSCTTSDSATLIKSYTLDLSSYDYIISAEFLVDGDYYIVEEFKHYNSGSIWTLLKNYGLHYILYLFLTILSVYAGIKTESIYIGAILLILSALLFVSIDPSLFTASVGGLLTFIGVVILWGASR